VHVGTKNHFSVPAYFIERSSVDSGAAMSE
jgi:hypothetical protein